MSKCKDCKWACWIDEERGYLCGSPKLHYIDLYIDEDDKACDKFEPKEKESEINHCKDFQKKESEESPGLEGIDAMRLIFGDRNTSEFCMIRGFELLWEHEDLDKAEWYLNKSHDLDPNKLYDEKWTTLGEMVARRRAKKEG